MTDVEYDESLQQLLMVNGFNHKNIVNLIPITRYSVSINNMLIVIDTIKEQYEKGCIFTLPSGKRDGKRFIFHTNLSSNEIRRRLELKVFL